MASVSKNEYIPTLDGWRAIAILLVLVCHGFAMIQGPAGYFPNEFWRSITVRGSLGVNLFFGISGFLICSRLLDEELDGGKISLKGFYIRRAFRILPSFLFYLLALRVLSAGGLITLGEAEWWSSLFFVRNYTPLANDTGWYTGHYWSLMVEEHFYLLAPSLLLFIPKGARLKTFVLLCVGISLWRTLEYRNRWISSAFLEPGFSFVGRTDLSIDALFWGAAGALALRNYRDRIAHWLRGAWLAPALIAAFLATEIVWVPQKGMTQAFLIIAILLSTILNPAAPFSKMLEAGWLRWIGRLSYSLYVWNNLFLIPDSITGVSPLSYLQYPPLNIAVLFAVAAASYYAIEKPLIQIGRRIAARATVKASANPESQFSNSKAS